MSRILTAVAVSAWGLLAVALGGPAERFAPEEPYDRAVVAPAQSSHPRSP